MRPPSPTTFSGPKLRARRLDKDLSVAELAKLADPTLRPQVLTSYEADTSKPSFDRLRLLATALEVEPVDLLDETRARAPLVWLREQVGYGQREVARTLGVSDSKMSRWEITSRLPAEMHAAIIELYEISQAELEAALADRNLEVRVNLASGVVEALDNQRGDLDRANYLTQLIVNDS